MQHILAVAALCALLAPGTAVAGGAHLGVVLGAVDDGGMKKLAYEGRGAYVIEVAEDGPADRAGMEDRDVIIEFDRDVVIGPGHLQDLLALHSPGDKVNVTVWRKGRNETFPVTLDRAEKKAAFFVGPRDAAKTIVLSGEPRAWLGIRTQDLTPQLGEHFGCTDGALVSEVIDDSPAARAGIEAGDVITRIGKEGVERPLGLTKAIGDREPGETVSVTLVRDGRELTKEVELGETPEKYRKGLPQFLSWTREGEEGGLTVLPEDLYTSQLEKIELERSEAHALQKELQELRQALTEQVKALRAELEEMRKNLKRPD